MRVQVDDLPRMESTSTSSAARNPAASAYLLFHLSSPASAAFLSGEFAMTISGIFTRVLLTIDFFVADLARDGATRAASPSILRKCGGQGASPRPAASSFAAISKSLSREPRAASGIPSSTSDQKPDVTAFTVRRWRPPNSIRRPRKSDRRCRSAIPSPRNCCSKLVWR